MLIVFGMVVRRTERGQMGNHFVQSRDHELLKCMTRAVHTV